MSANVQPPAERIVIPRLSSFCIVELAYDTLGGMSTLNLTSEEFERTISSDGIVLVDFWAAWCGPCRMFGPIFEKASEEYPEIAFAKVDTEAEQGLSGSLGISSIPTLMAFRDGILLFNQAGALPASSLEQLIKALQDVDMDDVRTKIEAEK
jgi:thioredoxin 1